MYANKNNLKTGLTAKFAKYAMNIYTSFTTLRSSRSWRLPLQSKSNLERHLVMFHFSVFNIPARFGHFKPAHIFHRLTRSRHRIFNGIFDACC